MSKLESLLQELCPNGVEYKKLSEVCLRQKGMAITAGQMKELNKENGEIRIFAAGNTTANVNYGDIPDSTVITKESIIVKSRGNIGFEYYTKPFTHKNELWSYARKTENVNLKFIFYYLVNNIEYFQAKTKTGKLPQISTPDTDNFLVPVPPLPVQEEIVRILDQFTQMETELQNKITAEIEARKKQKEHCKGKVLTFDPTVKWEMLENISELITKGTTPKSFAATGVSFIKTECFLNGKIDETRLSFVDKEIHETTLKRSILKENDILFTIAGATIGKCFLVPGKILPANTNQALAIIRLKNKVDVEFVRQMMTSHYMQVYIKQCVKGSAQPNLNLKQIRSFLIPNITFEQKQKIVASLNQIETVFGGIIASLEMELSARQTQYEYYRDKLLTFKARA